MNDVKDLLDLALADGHAPGPGYRVEPGADLARGRRLLRRRRRLAGVAGGTAVTAGIVAAALGLDAAGPAAARLAPAAGPGGGTATATAPTAPSSRPVHLRSLALVSYGGPQVPGYQVAEVPRGWVIQGGNAYAFVIAPRDDKNTDISVFVGKIVVMLKSTDEKVPTSSPRQPVAGRPGYLLDQGSTKTLVFQDAAGGWVDIQAPTSLGWDGARFARFGAGIQVLGNAKPGHG
jgi:hypothetical protein